MLNVIMLSVIMPSVVMLNNAYSGNARFSLYVVFQMSVYCVLLRSVPLCKVLSRPVWSC